MSTDDEPTFTTVVETGPALRQNGCVRWGFSLGAIVEVRGSKLALKWYSCDIMSMYPRPVVSGYMALFGFNPVTYLGLGGHEKGPVGLLVVLVFLLSFV